MKINILGDTINRLLAPLANYTKSDDPNQLLHLCIDCTVPDLPQVRFMMQNGAFHAFCTYDAPAGTVTLETAEPAVISATVPACYVLKTARAAGRRLLTFTIDHYVSITVSKHIERPGEDAAADPIVVTSPAADTSTAAAAPTTDSVAMEVICSCNRFDGVQTFCVPSVEAVDYQRASVCGIAPMLFGRALAFGALPLWLVRRNPRHYGVAIEFTCQGFRLSSESSRLAVDFHAGEDSYERKYRDSPLHFILPTTPAKHIADTLTREGDVVRMLYDHHAERVVLACGAYVFACPVLLVSQPAEAAEAAAAAPASASVATAEAPAASASVDVAEAPAASASVADATISPSVTLDRGELLDACQRFNVFSDKSLDLIFAPSGTLLVSSDGGECRLEGHPLGFDTDASADDADDFVAAYRICAKSIVSVLKLMEAKRVIISLIPGTNRLMLKGVETDHELTATLTGA